MGCKILRGTEQKRTESERRTAGVVTSTSVALISLSFPHSWRRSCLASGNGVHAIETHHYLSTAAATATATMKKWKIIVFCRYRIAADTCHVTNGTILV